METGFKEFMGISSDGSRIQGHGDNYNSLLMDIEIGKPPVSKEVVVVDNYSGLDNSSLVMYSNISNGSLEGAQLESSLEADPFSSTPSVLRPSSRKKVDVDALVTELAQEKRRSAELKGEVQKLYNKLNQAIRDKKCTKFCAKGARYKEMLAKKLEKYALVDREDIAGWERVQEANARRAKGLRSMLDRGEEDIAKALNSE